MFGKSTIKKFFGKQPEPLGTWKVGSNGFVNVINAKPPTKKQRKASGLTAKAAKSAIIAAAVADARRKNPDAKIVVKTKSRRTGSDLVTSIPDGCHQVACGP